MSRYLLASASFVALLAPAFGASVPVEAMTPTFGGDLVVKRVVVKFDDLNPANSQDALKLYDRINRVAVALCSSNPGGTGALLADKVETCRSKTVKQVVHDIGSDQLTKAATK